VPYQEGLYAIDPCAGVFEVQTISDDLALPRAVFLQYEPNRLICELHLHMQAGVHRHVAAARELPETIIGGKLESFGFARTAYEIKEISAADRRFRIGFIPSVDTDPRQRERIRIGRHSYRKPGVM
jgi:hypothetical protein